MKYSLVIYNETNIEEIKGFSKITPFNGFNENSLEDIVKFTNSFTNELELWEFLIYSGLINPQVNNADKLGIAFIRGKETIPTILPYGLSFKDHKKYFNVDFLKSYFSNRLTNINFMECFLNKYYHRLKNVKPFSGYLHYLCNAYEYYLFNKEIPIEAKSEMENFIKAYTLKKDKNGNYQINFTRVRELAMFATEYERMFKNKDNYEDVITNEDETIKHEIEHYKLLLALEALDEETRLLYQSKINELELRRQDNQIIRGHKL